MLPLYSKIIEELAHEYGLSDRLVKAIVMTESAGNPYAIRYEPHYKYLVNPIAFSGPLHITEDTEKMLQMCSWGLMQVMGGVVRELGFKEHLTKLTDPALAARYGCQQLIRLGKRYSLTEDVVAAYNAGSARRLPGGKYVNQHYVDTVIKFMKQNETRST